VRRRCPHCGREFDSEERLVRRYLFCKGRLRGRIARLFRRGRRWLLAPDPDVRAISVYSDQQPAGAGRHHGPV